MKNNDFVEIYEYMKQSKNVVVLAHQKPDGDAIGSLLAIKLILERINIQVDAVVTDIPEFAKLIPESEVLLTETSKEYDTIILADISSKKRLGELDYLYDENKRIIIFDHHEVELEKEYIHYIEPLISSTTMIIYKLARANNIEIDKLLAEYLYIGLLTDTGGFAYQNTTSEVFDMASYLLKTGINHNKLYTDFIKKEYDLDYLLLEKNVIDNLEIINKNIAFSFLSNEVINKYPYDAPKEFVDLGRYIKDVEVSILIVEEEPNSYRVSLRSRKYLDVSEVAKKFNGGGHKHASGIRFNGDYNINKENIINEVIKFL